MVYQITNKKYQPIKVFVSNVEAVLISAKDSKRVNVLSESQHMKDLAQAGFITVKKVEV